MIAALQRRAGGQAVTASAIGVGMVLAYNALSASKEVVAGSIVQSLNPIALTALVFAIVLATFQLLARLKGAHVYALALSHPGLLIRLNVFTCGAWIGFFYSVSYLEPAVVSALMVGLGPALASVLVPMLYGGSASRSEAIGATGILASTVYIACIAVYGDSSLGAISMGAIARGGVSALLGSVAMVGSSIYSKRLSDAGVPPVAIMAHRFYLLEAVAFGIVFAQGIHVETFATRAPTILALALFGVVVPLWALQIGIKYLRPTVVMVLISTGPAFTYAIQLLDPRLMVRPAVFIGVAALCLSATLPQIRVLRRPGKPHAGHRRVSEA